MHNLDSLITLQRICCTYTFIGCLFNRLTYLIAEASFSNEYLQRVYNAHSALLSVAKIRRMKGRYEGQSLEAQGEGAPSVLSGNSEKDAGHPCFPGWEAGTGTQQLCQYHREKWEEGRSIVQHLPTFRNYWRTVGFIRVPGGKTTSFLARLVTA